MHQLPPNHPKAKANETNETKLTVVFPLMFQSVLKGLGWADRSAKPLRLFFSSPPTVLHELCLCVRVIYAWDISKVKKKKRQWLNFYSSMDKGLNFVMREIHSSFRFKKLKTKHTGTMWDWAFLISWSDKLCRLFLAHIYIYTNIRVLCLDW